MADPFAVSLEGGQELDAKLKRAVGKLAPGQLEKLFLPEAKAFAMKLRAVLPLGSTGNLRRAVYSHIPKRKASRPLPAASAGISGRIAPHRHIVELGTTDRYAASGAYRGQMPRGFYFTNMRRQEWAGMRLRIVARIRAMVDKAL